MEPGNGFARIERAETVNDLTVLNAIIEVSEDLKVARGNLGIEMGEASRITSVRVCRVLPAFRQGTERRIRFAPSAWCLG